ncbi:hypothetical protein B6I21_01210 [candidate division KSB1 bacterium 4572_119]|nr:MAG: hypothetical protein B6I21_01210 [candidate division KSB1 bacterium 4572_119]
MRKIVVFLMVVLFLLSSFSLVFAGGKWYNHYNDGLKLMKAEKWASAIEKFNRAIIVKKRDTRKIKTYGMHFISYYPHREKGICYYKLGQFKRAKNELALSLKQQYSSRAQEFYGKLGGTQVVDRPVKPKDLPKDPTPPIEQKPVIKQPDYGSGEVKQVGERMGIAVLPFETTGLGVEMGDINVVEQIMTTFYNMNRFKLFERTQLEKIMEEQKLGMTGIIDATTAAEIGKGIGVDAIVLGTVTRAGQNIQINARLIDTETSEIIAAQDASSTRTSITHLKSLIKNLAEKIINDLPLVEGFVIAVSGDRLTLDIGLTKKIKKGMKCVVYREGQEIVHPITKKVLGKKTEELGEVKLIEVYPEYSIGKVTFQKTGLFEIGNKVVTK